MLVRFGLWKRMSAVKKQGLAEQLAELSNPKPGIFPEDDVPKICDFDEYEETTPPVRMMTRRSRREIYLEEDPRYAGRAISRKEMEELDDNLLSDSSDESVSSFGEESADNASASEEAADEVNSSEQSAGELPDEVGGSEEEEGLEYQEDGHESQNEITAGISLASLQDDIEKGDAVKQQISLWGGLLEGRIRLHKALGHCNRIPQSDSLPAFKKSGAQQLQQALGESQTALRNLLDSLLGLQQLVLLKNKDTSLVLDETAAAERDGSPTSVPEISSGDESDGAMDVGEAQADGVGSADSEPSVTSRMRRKRRKHRGWVGANGTRDYESYNARIHDTLKHYRDSTITKWSNKTRLASGKVNSKAFVQVDHSILGQIQHVLKDKPRLIKRTQLRRTVYHILGRPDVSEEEGSAVVGNSQSSHDVHLEDYDEEVYDDDDFYHQLLRELIERKMNFTETTDPIAMGRQWLELQKLRTKVKKSVDTKASKGRKIRYDVHPKLVGFMAPIQKGTLSDTSRNDLFSSLFGVYHGVKDCR